MPRARTWYRNGGLKRDVLAQIDAHCAAGVLGPVQLDDGEVRVYGWIERPHLDRMRSAFGIPVSILALGTDHGLPDTPAGIVWTVRRTREFFDAVPVGADVAWVVDELAARRLVDEDEGLVTTIEDRSIERLLHRVAEALRHGLMDEALEAEVAEQLREYNGEIPRQWQESKRVEPRTYAHVRALATAKLACTVPRDPMACSRVIAESFGSMVLPWRAGSPETVRAAFLALLRSAG